MKTKDDNEIVPPSRSLNALLDEPVKEWTDEELRKWAAARGWTAPYDFVPPEPWPTSDRSTYELLLLSQRLAQSIEGVKKAPGARTLEPVERRVKSLARFGAGEHPAFVKHVSFQDGHIGKHLRVLCETMNASVLPIGSEFEMIFRTDNHNQLRTINHILGVLKLESMMLFDGYSTASSFDPPKKITIVREEKQSKKAMGIKFLSTTFRED